jgi:glycerophosphoryl diester phosphodiesterase
LLLGHRGVRPLPFLGPRWRKSELPPENTIDAFDYAMAHGCDGFEFDLRYTLDRRSLLLHDADVKGHNVAATEHSVLERRMERKLASLEDTLRRYASSAWLDIELKIAGEEETLVAALRACPPQRGFVVSSFLPDALLRLHEIDPSLPLGYICDREDALRLWSGLPIKFFIPHHSLVSQLLVGEAHRRKMQLITWTVNRREDMLRFASWGVDGLISDDPKLLSETFPRAKAAAAGA